MAHSKANGRQKRYLGIEGFCGPGGMSRGLHDAGFQVPLAFDVNALAVRTYNHNLSGRGIVARAEELSGRRLLRLLGLRRGDLDLFSGGPPCQGFSKQKRGAHMGDDRNKLILEFARLVREIQPRFFLLENVAMLGQKRGVDFIERISDELGRFYEIFDRFYNSAHFGLAQTRERFVVVGKRKDVIARFEMPEPILKKWKTVGEVLRGLPEPPKDYTDHPDFPNHQRARVTEINIKRFSFVPQGGGWRDIPARYRLRCHREVDVSRGGWPDVYGRLQRKGQCPTITGGFDSFTRGRYGHPLHDRPLTPREAARIQGFPDSHVFFGTRADIRSQIGNAVPPPLAQTIAGAVLDCLKLHDFAERKESDNHGMNGRKVPPRGATADRQTVS